MEVILQANILNHMKAKAIERLNKQQLLLQKNLDKFNHLLDSISSLRDEISQRYEKSVEDKLLLDELKDRIQELKNNIDRKLSKDLLEQYPI